MSGSCDTCGCADCLCPKEGFPGWVATPKVDYQQIMTMALQLAAMYDILENIAKCTRCESCAELAKQVLEDR